MNIQPQLEGLSETAKLDFLKNHSYLVQEGQYFRPFDSEDKQRTNEDFTLKSIEIQRIEDEFAAIKEEFKAKLKALNTSRHDMMTSLMQNGEWLDGAQYGFDDQVAGTMTFYDERGQFINSRRLTPNERQLTILSKANNS